VAAEIRRKIALRTFDITSYIQPEGARVSLEHFYGLYLKYREQQHEIGHLAKNTISTDRYALQLLLSEIDPATRMLDITPATAEKFVHGLRRKKNKYRETYRPGAINSYVKHIRGAFSYAVKAGLIPSNPFENIKPLQVRREIRYLTSEEIQQLRDYFSQDPAAWKLDSFNFAIWTGCRLSSIVAIKSSDLGSRMVEGKEYPVFRFLEKGDKVRWIPLFPEALQLIQGRMETLRDPEKALAMVSHPVHYPMAAGRIQDGFIFWEVRDRSTITKAFTEAKRALGLDPELTFHSLRKSYGTYALEQGASLSTVQYVLGHSSIRITEEIYADITMEKVLKEMEPVKGK